MKLYIVVGSGILIFIILILFIVLISYLTTPKYGSFKIAVQKNSNEIGEPRTRRVMLASALSEEEDLDAIVYAETTAFADFQHSRNELPLEFKLGEIDIFTGPSITGYSTWKHVYSNPKKSQRHFGMFYDSKKVKLVYSAGVANGVSASDDASYIKCILKSKMFRNSKVSVIICQGRNNYTSIDLPLRNKFVFDEENYRIENSLPKTRTNAELYTDYTVMGGLLFYINNANSYDVRTALNVVTVNFGTYGFVPTFDYNMDMESKTGDKFHVVATVFNKEDDS